MHEPCFQSFCLSHTERRFQPHPKNNGWKKTHMKNSFHNEWPCRKPRTMHLMLRLFIYLFLIFSWFFFPLPFIVWLGICVNVCFMVSLHCAKVSCYGHQTFSENVSESERETEKSWKKTWSKIKIKYAFYACVLGSSSARYVVYRLSFVCFYWVSFQPNIVCVCLLF